jgi:DNA-binding NarL/FixJ family response regulator
MSVRVLIVAEHALAAESIRRAFRHTPHFEVIGFVSRRRADAIPTGIEAPDVVLIDDNGRQDGSVMQLSAIRAATDGKLVLLASRMDSEWLASASAVGLDAVILRDVKPTALGTLVGEIAAGTIFLPAGQARRVHQPANPQQAALTARELEILLLVASGASNARIATRLWVTEQTVKFHLSNVYRKLGVTNRTQASHYAHISGLVAQPALPAPDAIPDAA